MEIFKIKISPEVLRDDIRNQTYSGVSFGYYSGMSYILSGGTGGSSLLDLSIPVLLKQNFEDIGYYSPFDGDISQCENDISFLLVNGQTPNEICLYNTTPPKTFLENMSFQVNWGDGSATQSIFASSCHTYLVDGTYQIIFSGSNNFGSFVQIKNFTVPYSVSSYLNPQGIVNFSLNTGSWSTAPTSYVYNYFFDANNSISAQLSSNFTTVPFLVSGQTISRLNELRQYGPVPFVNGRIVNLENGTTGVTNSQSDQFTAYTINDVLYLDLSGGSSFFYAYSYGLTPYNIVASAMTKFEYLMNVIAQPEIQSNVFIERGKTSGVESFRRIGEISNTGDLNNYGYGYFDVRNFDDI